MPTLGRTIATWAHSLQFEDLSKKTVHEVKRRFLDSIGCALGAYAEAPATITRELASSYRDPQGATLWGTQLSVKPEMAAFANGAAVRYLDFNDTYLSLEPAHPSDNLPAVLSIAESEKRTGKELILASVIAYELQCRLCDAASLRSHGWDHVFYGALSTALGAGRLLMLSIEQLEHALGLAGVCNIATRQTRTGQLSMWKACAFSNAARNGIMAAELARRGFTGPYEIFEGPKGIFKQLTGPFSLTLAEGGEFMIDRTYIKFWPAEYHSQSAIDAALKLRLKIKSPELISKLTIGSFEAAVSIIGSEKEKWRPTSRETADHSMPFCVAAALIDGDVTLESFDDHRLTDPKILALCDKISIHEEPALNAGYPKGIPNHLTVTLNDGTVLSERVDFPRGHAGNPMTDEEVVRKFTALAERELSATAIQQIIDRVMSLESSKSPGEIVKFLCSRTQAA